MREWASLGPFVSKWYSWTASVCFAAPRARRSWRRPALAARPCSPWTCRDGSCETRPPRRLRSSSRPRASLLRGGLVTPRIGAEIIAAKHDLAHGAALGRRQLLDHGREVCGPTSGVAAKMAYLVAGRLDQDCRTGFAPVPKDRAKDERMRRADRRNALGPAAVMERGEIGQGDSITCGASWRR